MRPLTLGVLVSNGAFATGPDESAAASGDEIFAESPRDGVSEGIGARCPADADRAAEGVVDLRAASDLVDAIEALGHRAVPIAADDDLDPSLRRVSLDGCLLALHGRKGGSGEAQAVLAMRGVPFAGPPAACVALAFDKVRARQMLAYHNLPVPAAVALGEKTRGSERALELLGWPCYVKPRRGAHGLGVSRVGEIAEVRLAVERALDVDRELLLEREFSGREIQVVVLGERVLGAAEVLERHDAHATCGIPGSGDSIVTPPDLSRGRLDGVCNLARRAVSALGLGEGLTRVDVLVHPRHNEAIVEVEPLPPLHRDSTVARVAAAAGLSYEDLVGAIIDRIPLRLDPPQPVARPLLQ